MSIHIVLNTPVGTRTGTGFATRADGCSLAEIETPEYPAEHTLDARTLAIYRVDTCDLSLREAATATGLTPEQISGIEHARYRFGSDEDRLRYIAALDGARRK